MSAHGIRTCDGAQIEKVGLNTAGTFRRMRDHLETDFEISHFDFRSVRELMLDRVVSAATRMKDRFSCRAAA